MTGLSWVRFSWTPEGDISDVVLHKKCSFTKWHGRIHWHWFSYSTRTGMVIARDELNAWMLLKKATKHKLHHKGAVTVEGWQDEV